MHKSNSRVSQNHPPSWLVNRREVTWNTRIQDEELGCRKGAVSPTSTVPEGTKKSHPLPQSCLRTRHPPPVIDFAAFSLSATFQDE